MSIDGRILLADFNGDSLNSWKFLEKAAQSDDLVDTVHYGLVFETIKKQVEQHKYKLIERLAGAICQDIFQEFPAVQAITIKISKQNPPINGHYDAVGIELERQRP